MGSKRVAVMRAGLRGGSALLATMMMMGTAMAQTAEPEAQEGEAIVVTGSRIPRPDV
ncbi:hypothetical protein INQ29_25260, partial [Escherichia coli]|nr:hypothetical protein [Escherichia coli]